MSSDNGLEGCFMRLMLAALVLAVAVHAQKPADELDVRKPVSVILPPPANLAAVYEHAHLIIRFRRIPLERVAAYQVSRLHFKDWEILGTVQTSPIRLGDCRKAAATYAIAAVDSSGMIGSKARITTDYFCHVIELRK